LQHLFYFILLHVCGQLKSVIERSF